jgi:hypothetical protein
MAVMITTGKLDPHYEANPPERLGFAEAVRRREAEFPLLALAAKEMILADRPKIEWLVPGKVVRDDYNFLQIVRQTDAGETKEKALTTFLSYAERLLRYGRRYETPKYHRYMGGVRDLLGRDERAGDQLKLAVLRDLVYLPNRHLPTENPYGEWLAEFSLVAIPGS